jgi:hypothetical protein
MEQQTKVDIKPKITRSSLRLSALEHLKDATEDTRKSSEKLKRLFERNTYQKKTQLTVLKRYKRRLDSIEKEDEERRKRRQQKKIKLPQIKKFVGSFFTPNAAKDPMKALATLSAFKTATSISNGKWFDAFMSGLATAGFVAGPALLGLGLNRMFRGGEGGVKPRRSPKVTGDTGKFKFRNPFKRGPKVTGDTGGLNIRNPFRRKPKITGDAGRFTKIGKAFGRFGKSAIPIAGAALGAADAAIRANEGDVTGASIAGTSASLDAISAGLTATGIGVVPAAVLSAVSFGLDMVNLVRDLTGASEAESKNNKNKRKDKRPEETDIQTRLRKETEKQKDQQKQKPQETGNLTFSKTLNSYEKVIIKFEEFSKSFTGIGMTSGDSFNEGQSRSTPQGNPTSPSGNNVPTTPEGLPTLPPTNLLPGQRYGAPRRYGGHSGQDFDISGNEKFYSRLGGDVIFARNIGGEYGNVVEVYNKDLGVTEVIAEANNIMSNIKEGMTIAPGTPVVYGERTTPTAGGSVGVVHYEIVKGVGGISNGNRNTLNPLEYLNSKEYKDYIKTKVNKKQTPSQQPQKSQQQKTSVQSVPGTKYTLRGSTLFKGTDGKYYETGSSGNFLEVDKRNWEYIKKNGTLVSLSSLTSNPRDIEKRTSYEEGNNTIIVSMNSPQPPQTQPQIIMDSGGSRISASITKSILELDPSRSFLALT